MCSCMKLKKEKKNEFYDLFYININFTYNYKK